MPDTEKPVGSKVGTRCGKVRRFAVARPPIRSILECEDALFHFNSAVIMPSLPFSESGTADGSSGSSDQKKVTGALILFSAYKFFEANPEKGVIIVGHTDTSGGVEYNFELSLLRAENIYHLLVGNQSSWAELCESKHRIEDYQQILNSFGFPAGPIDNILGEKTRGGLKSFAQWYNANKKSIGHGDQPNIPEHDLTGQVLGKKTWNAFFGFYMWALAQQLGISLSEEEFAQYRDLVKFADPAQPYIGCGESFPVDEGEKENYRSQANRRVELLFFDPGEMPGFTAPPFSGKTYTRSDIPIYLPNFYKQEYIEPGDLPTVAIDIQSVDGMGHPVGNAKLLLKHSLGDEHSVTTDKNGYVKVEELPPGNVRVCDPDGNPFRFFAHNQQAEAVIFTHLAGIRINSVVVEPYDFEEQRENQIYNHMYGPKYIAPGSPEPDPADLPVPEPEPLPDEPDETDNRYRVLAFDNLWMLARTDDEEIDHEVLIKQFGQYVADYQIKPKEVDYLVLLFQRQRGEVRMFTSGGKELGKFKTRLPIDSPWGAYAPGPVPVDGKVLFVDVATMSGLMTSGETLRDIDELIASEELDRFNKLYEKHKKGIIVCYSAPNNESIDFLALHGGCGRLEAYTHPDNKNAAIDKRIHTRNLAYVRTSTRAHRRYINTYVGQVEEAKSEDEIRALGPPLEPYRFPTPRHASDQQMLDLFNAANTSTLKAYSAIAKRCDFLMGRASDGTIFLRTKFSLTLPGEISSKSSKQAVAAKLAENPVGFYDDRKISWNFDFTDQGVIKKTTASYSAGLQGNVGKGSKKLPIKGGFEGEVDLKTGETQTSFAIESKNRFGIEIDDGGTLKLKHKGAVVSTNKSTGGFGYTFSTPESESFPIKGEIYVGVHWQLAREESILAYLVKAPGFFERRSVNKIIHPQTHWARLRPNEQAALMVLGFTQETWDRKYIDPAALPKSTGTKGNKLKPGEQVAITKLGIPFEEWHKLWIPIKKQAEREQALRKKQK